MTALLLQGDARALPLGDESVQCVVTSPPYWGLRDYGVSGQLGLEATPDEYVAHMVEVFREVRRVLRPDGTLWLNFGDSYAGSNAVGRAGSKVAALDRHRWGTEYDAALTKHGGADANYTDAERSVIPPGLKPKDLVGIPWRVAFALQADGWWLRSDIVWSKPNPMPESVTDRPTKAHEYLFLLTKSPRYFYDADAIRAPVRASTVARLAQNGGHPVHNGDRDRDYPGSPQTLDVQRMADVGATGRNARTVWTIATQPYPGAHFATYPEKLVEPCIKAGSAAGDVVLDPFNGSGTTGRVAIRLGRRYVGLDISREYLSEQARQRTTNIQIGLEAAGL